jgi:hypothetical protein
MEDKTVPGGYLESVGVTETLTDTVVTPAASAARDYGRTVPDGTAERTPIEPDPIEPALIEPALIEPALIEPALIEPELIEPELVPVSPTLPAAPPFPSFQHTPTLPHQAPGNGFQSGRDSRAR